MDAGGEFARDPDQLDACGRRLPNLCDSEASKESELAAETDHPDLGREYIYILHSPLRQQTKAPLSGVVLLQTAISMTSSHSQI